MSKTGWIKYWTLLTGLFALMMIAGCGEKKTADVGVNDSDSVEAVHVKIDSVYVNQLTHEQLDSLEFRLTHHYTLNDNFVVKSDSLKLVPREDEATDTCVVHKGDILVVVKIKRNYTEQIDSLDMSNADANLMKSMKEANREDDLPEKNLLLDNDTLATDTVHADTVWIKVAGSQYNMGWLTESTLLKHTVPNDNISQMLDFLTGTRFLWMGGILLLGVLGLFLHMKYNNRIKIVRLNEMDSFYPFLLFILVAFLACWYASIQKFAPEFWQEYYFHPTLNPFLVPPVMAVLIITVWLILIVIIAILIETYNNFPFLRGAIYLIEIMGAAMFVYLVISWTTFIYIGYFLFVVLVWFLLVLYNGYVKCRYECGNCGQRIKEKGKCPHCGAIVE